MRVLNFGSVNIDVTYSVENFVRDGETIVSSTVARHAGGKGFNQSVALAHAGVSVCHAGLIGEDGVFLRDLLTAENVNTEYLRVTDTPTGTAIIQLNSSGNNCIILYPGANEKIDSEFVDEVFREFTSDDVLLIQNEVRCLEKIVESACRKNMRIAINPSPINSCITQDMLRKAQWILVNEIEAAELASCSNIDRCLGALSALYPAAEIVMTLGSKGVLCQSGKESFARPAFPVKAVDTTGAGDTFTGFFLASVITGQDMDTALDIASMAAALSVTKSGAAESIPTRERVMQALEEQNSLRATPHNTASAATNRNSHLIAPLG